MNGSGFADVIIILLLFNGSTTVSIDISLDGSTDHAFIPPQGTVILDFQANHSDNPNSASGTKYGRKGQLIWGKTAAHPKFLQIIGFR